MSSRLSQSSSRWASMLSLHRVAMVCGSVACALTSCATAEYGGAPDDTLGNADNGGNAGVGRGGTSAAGRAGFQNGSGGTRGGITGGAAGKSGIGGAGTGSGASGGSGNAGSAGKAGASASGGSSGSAGANGTGGSGQGGAAAVDGFSVKYKALNTGARSPAVECQLVIANAGILTVPLSEFVLRYYFTSEVPAPVVSINWAGVNPGFTDLKASLVTSFNKLTPSVPGADSYVEIGFSAGAPTITPGKMAEISWKVHAPDYSIEFTQTGDYSFDAAMSGEPADFPRAVLLRNGNVVWGAPP